MCGELELEKNGKIVHVRRGDTLPLKAEGNKVIKGVWGNWAQAEKIREHWATNKAGSGRIVAMHKVPVRSFNELGKWFSTGNDWYVLFARDRQNFLRLVTIEAGALKGQINHGRRPLFVREDYVVPDFGG